MSNFNYMDKVPVKIVEKYKPPPRIYQLPQSVVNKLQLPAEHYYQDPMYSYDFQLEKKVQAKLPEYRRMRQIEREARQCRREKREKERLRQIKEKHKQMLGAVNYPNAAELSSSESEDEENSFKTKHVENKIKITLNKNKNWQHHNFDTILQPTVLTLGEIEEVCKDNAFAAFEKTIANQKKNDIKQKNNLTSSSVNSINKVANTFNYKDFEEDTSSPFDNIELKTINDLDILAQVLHDTQLKANNEKNEIIDETVEQQQQPVKTKEVVETTTPVENLQTTIEHNKAALEKVNFSDINLELTQEEKQQQQQNDNIPTQHYINNTFPTSEHNLENGIPHPNSYQIYQNQNFLYSPNCNRLQATGNSALQQFHYIGNNANNYVFNTAISQIQQDENVQTFKSKSVPDILRELQDEVRNSEMRRTRLRNHSCNRSDEKEVSDTEEKNVPDQQVKKIVSNDDCLKQLAEAVQLLAKKISLMGFPLDRVAKVAQIYGDDDKKIIEHLIPLTELLDLGFEETQISEALIKFNNNKEKALEHLIS